MGFEQVRGEFAGAQIGRERGRGLATILANAAEVRMRRGAAGIERNRLSRAGHRSCEVARCPIESREIRMSLAPRRGEGEGASDAADRTIMTAGGMFDEPEVMQGYRMGRPAREDFFVQVLRRLMIAGAVTGERGCEELFAAAHQLNRHGVGQA